MSYDVWMPTDGPDRGGARHVAAALSAPEFASAVRRVSPSDANFLLVRVANCRAVCDALAERHGVVVRYRGGMLHCDGCMRVTIGTEEENERMLAALRRAVAEPA